MRPCRIIPLLRSPDFFNPVSVLQNNFHFSSRASVRFAVLFLAGLLWLAARSSQAGDFLLSRWIQPVPRHSVLAQPGYYVWGGSVVEDGGQYHMFYSRWPTNTYAFGDGWLFGSEICHAVANNPGGPFTPSGVVLGRRTNDPAFAFWDSQTQHNPHIRRFGNKFYLYYMASVDPGTNTWPGVDQRNRIQRNQRIGVIVADSIADLLNTNYVHSVRSAAPIVAPVYSTNAATDRVTNPTDFAGNRIVNNQTVTQRPDGKFQLIHKSNWPQSPNYGHGFALADDPAGPFTLIPGPIISDQGREDENHWYDSARGKFFLICKNFSAAGTEQLESTDSTNWISRGIQFGTIIRWADGADEVLEALERPQLLRDTNGQPVMLYMAARRALAGGAKESLNVHIPLRPSPSRASVMTNAATVKTNGGLLAAVNFGATNSLVVNGLAFTPSGTNLAVLAANHGLVQSGGAAGAALIAGTVNTAYTGLPEFEGVLDTLVWQSGATRAGARLSFVLTGLPIGRTCRLQIFFGESRAGFRHGPQTIDVAGEWSAAFDYGPASLLVSPGVTAMKFETDWIATRPTETVTLSQRVGGGHGLQISAYALHDISPPALVSVANVPPGFISITWNVVPGFSYSVWSSENLADWSVEPQGFFQPGGASSVDYTFTAPANSQPGRFFRLMQSEP